MELLQSCCLAGPGSQLEKDIQVRIKCFDASGCGKEGASARHQFRRVKDELKVRSVLSNRPSHQIQHMPSVLAIGSEPAHQRKVLIDQCSHPGDLAQCEVEQPSERVLSRKDSHRNFEQTGDAMATEVTGIEKVGLIRKV